MPDAHTRIDSLKEDIRAIGDSVLDLQTLARAHDVKLEQVVAMLAAHDARFDAIDARYEAHDRRFDDHDRRFDDHDRRFDQIDSQLAEILARLPQRSE
jgi:hypothetical protein